MLVEKTKHYSSVILDTQLEDKIKWCNQLLEEIDFDNDSEEMKQKIDKLNAIQDDEIGIFGCEFNDGCYLSVDIASGSSNYYDNVVLFDKNGNELYVCDCDYEITNGIEIETENDIYICELKKEGK